MRRPIFSSPFKLTRMFAIILLDSISQRTTFIKVLDISDCTPIILSAFLVQVAKLQHISPWPPPQPPSAPPPYNTAVEYLLCVQSIMTPSTQQRREPGEFMGTSFVPHISCNPVLHREGGGGDMKS